MSVVQEWLFIVAVVAAGMTSVAMMVSHTFLALISPQLAALDNLDCRVLSQSNHTGARECFRY